MSMATLTLTTQGPVWIMQQPKRLGKPKNRVEFLQTIAYSQALWLNMKIEHLARKSIRGLYQGMYFTEIIKIICL